MTLQEAAEFLGIKSEPTLRNWLQGGWFPSATKGDGVWTFNRADVEAVKARMGGQVSAC